ncbi:metal-sulfur cluster assembly factor [Halorubellus litoreus]|uniref:Metal-sulfur cluster assembly factor n=1 Tax=Halorubellus litoreus TaxID=755308 RepID=A0ABD5VL32_9EURY
MTTLDDRNGGGGANDSSTVDVEDPIEVVADFDGSERPRVARVEAALRAVVDPCSGANGSNLDVVEMGLVDDIQVAGDHVIVDLMLTTPACDMVAYFHEAIETHVGDLQGVDTVDVRTDNGFEWTETMMTDAAKRRRDEVRQAYVERHRKKALYRDSSESE